MDLGITDKLALVTGAGKGLGRAIAERLASQGARLILLSRSESQLQELHKTIAKNGKEHYFYPVDLSDEKATTEITKTIHEQCGNPSIMVHNLGGSLNVKDAFAPLEDWKKVWHLNLGAAIQLNNIFVPQMVKDGWGRVVHISSSSATNYTGSPSYASAKAAVNGYVKAVSRVLARDNVILSAVSPGPILAEGRFLTKIQTENPDLWAEYCRNRLPIGRLGEPEEIASAVVFLCSALSSYAAGSIINIDGGNT